ncbi:MAG: hypothetical protein FWD69_09560 [Polyangiaceae bacterium]|nr:hypothetical protein [Polyangiaceae bacterium]
MFLPRSALANLPGTQAAPDRWYYSTDFVFGSCLKDSQKCSAAYGNAAAACSAEINAWNSTYGDSVTYQGVESQYVCKTDNVGITYWAIPGCSNGQLSWAADQGTYVCTMCPQQSHPASTGDGCACDDGYSENNDHTACVKPIVVGFFNGIKTTPGGAASSLQAIDDLMGPDRNGTPLNYQLFYNQTNGFLEDVAEVFEQRSAELDGALNNRWEYFWDMLSGRQNDSDSFLGRLVNATKNWATGGTIGAFAGVIDGLSNDILGKAAAWLAGKISDPPTEADYAAHLAKLNSLSSTSKGFVLVAHSQGNLFVNHAYDGFAAAHPESPTKVVHVAPASPTLRGDYILSSSDLVINALRIQGITSVPPINWTNPPSTKDLLGHGLVEIYLDPGRDGRARVQTMTTTALDAVNN